MIGRLQNILGAVVVAASDRNPNRAADIEKHTRRGLALCHAARSYEAPIETRLGPWGDAPEDCETTREEGSD